MVLLMPTLLLVVWIALGAAMYFYGRTTALAAAQAAAAAGAAEHGTTADCVRTATDLAARAGDALAGLQVTCQARPRRSPRPSPAAPSASCPAGNPSPSSPRPYRERRSREAQLA